jgi:histidinol-phosphate aminotransferase
MTARQVSLSALTETLRPEFAELSPYQTEPGEYPVRLDANEAPSLLSDAARQSLLDVVAGTAWERYPDPGAERLRAAIAKSCAVSSDEILVGVGSDEIITLLMTALVQPRPGRDLTHVLTTTPTFVMYRLSARVRGLRVLEVPLDAGWDLSSDGLRRGIEMVEPNLIFVASPNNPTGTMASPDRLTALIESAPQSIVVIDEAYIAYADRDQLEAYRKYDNVAILRTLSKVGFAALRLGWLIARPELVRELDKVRLPYNLSTLTQRLGTHALEALGDEIARIASTVRAERERVRLELGQLGGVEVTPSQANFLWIRCEKPAAEVFDALKARGVLTRSFHARGGRLAHQLRVTIGTRAENDAFLQAFAAALA